MSEVAIILFGLLPFVFLNNECNLIKIGVLFEKI
jgi:hypothetical protein